MGKSKGTYNRSVTTILCEGSLWLQNSAVVLLTHFYQRSHLLVDSINVLTEC